MPAQSGSIDISASAATVFRYITEPECLVRWVGGMKSSERQGSGGLQPGTKSVDVVESFGHTMEVSTEVARVEQDRAIELKLRSRAFEGGAVYLIEPIQGGVRLRVEGDVNFKGVYKLTGPMMAPAMQRKLEQDLARLKSLTEAEDAKSA